MMLDKDRSAINLLKQLRGDHLVVVSALVLVVVIVVVVVAVVVVDDADIVCSSGRCKPGDNQAGYLSSTC